MKQQNERHVIAYVTIETENLSFVPCTSNSRKKLRSDYPSLILFNYLMASQFAANVRIDIISVYATVHDSSDSSN